MFLGFPVGESREKTCIFPMQVTWNGLFEDGKIHWFLCFIMGKLK
jgi:hypothetical protein